MKYYMHVNFLERLFPVDEIIARCADAGYDGIELRNRDSSGKNPLSAYLEHCCGVAARYRLDVVFGGSSLAHAADADARAQSLADLKTVIDISSAHGVRLLNVFTGNLAAPDVPYHHFDAHGSAIATDAQWTAAVDFFQRAGDHAAERGVNLCFETHNVYLHDLGEPTARLVDRIGRKNVLTNLDYGNMYLNRRSQGMDQELQLLAGRIGYVHLKNLRAFNHLDSRLYYATSLADGDINNFLLVRKLLAAGYSGALTIENTMAGDKRRWVEADLAYLKSIIADLGQVEIEVGAS
jgi:sugar phosphate isomerase/epimerase